MFIIIAFISFTLFPLSFPIFAEETSVAIQSKDLRTVYKYQDRDHTFGEDIQHISILYGVSWALYYLTQRDTFINQGSIENYKSNFGRLVLDKDEPAWNWIGHSLSGSQAFLYYRANGYARLDAFKMVFIQSTLFEVTTEIYTEPASLQDLYQTPIFGLGLGIIIENTSLILLNSGNTFLKTLGHIINPMTLFGFFEGKVQVMPQINQNGPVGLNIFMSF